MNKSILLKSALLVLFVFLCNAETKAETIIVKDTVYGTVVDQNKNPIPGAMVLIDGQSEYAYTDLDGRFRILCAPKAKRVKVSFSKLPEVTKKIKPDMEIRMDISGFESPIRYQWFLGVNAGITILNTNLDLWRGSGSYAHSSKKDTSYKGIDFSIMGGRVKTFGWYAKYKFSNSGRFSEQGPIAGGLLRLGAPIFLYLGGGVSMLNLKDTEISRSNYSKTSGVIDLGLIVRVKEHFAVNWGGALALPSSGFDMGYTFSAGVSYFFSK